MPAHRSRISLVATVLNERRSLPALLASIADQTRAPDEVIIVDGGSDDGSYEILRTWASESPDRTALQVPGANISRGRNAAIARASGDIIAVTDGGVRLDPAWLERLAQPLEADCSIDVASGFFTSDPRTLFEWVLGATVLPTGDEIEPGGFLPSSRSVAIRRSMWEKAGGYPEWLDVCEDLVFDRALQAAGAQFVWVPDAIARFRPRAGFRAFFRQYYRYGRGDGKADLWRAQHVMRYIAFAAGALLLARARRQPGAAGLLVVGTAAYAYRPARRLVSSARARPTDDDGREPNAPRWDQRSGPGDRHPPFTPGDSVDFVRAAALILPIRIVGDVAKMLGYPVGLLWRTTHRDRIPAAGLRDDVAAARPRPVAATGSCDVTVIIVNYNTRERLRSCLRSVARSNGPPTIQVIVVDNASSDGSANMVAAEFPDVELVRNSANVGFARANNGAIERSCGRTVLLLNPDTELPPDALPTLVGYLDAHSDVGAVGPKLVLADGTLDLACRRSFPTPSVAFYRLSGLSRLFPGHPRFGRYNLRFLDADVEVDVDAVSGACMLVRREVIDQVGGLDERFFMYGEDLDWAYRIKAQGWRIRYNPGVVVRHYKGEASRQDSQRATIAFYDAMRLFYEKHYRSSTPPALRVVIVAGVWARLMWSLVKNALRAPSQRRVAT